MLKTKNPLFLVPFKYGLVGALLNILAIVVLFYLGNHPLLLNPLFDTRLPLNALFIFVGMKVFREEYNEGEMHFWQGLTVAMIIFILMALMTAMFIYIFSEISNTHFMSEFIRIKSGQLIANKEDYIEAFGVGEKAYNYAIESLPNTQPIDLALHYIRQSMPIGLFLTLILSILMRNKNQTNTK